MRHFRSAMASKRKATSLDDESSGGQHSAGQASSSGDQHSDSNFSLVFVDADNFDPVRLPPTHLIHDPRPPIDPDELEEILGGDRSAHCREG